MFATPFWSADTRKRNTEPFDRQAIADGEPPKPLASSTLTFSNQLRGAAWGRVSL